MDWGQVAAFVLVAAAIVASPGPDTLLIIRNTLRFGRAAGFSTLAGIQAGLLVHISLAVGGLSALLYFSETAFRAVALLGAIYLGWLGVQTIRHGVVGNSASDAENSTMSTISDMANSAISLAAKTRAIKNGFHQGVLCNLFNPKVLILFVALLPGFVNYDAGGRERQIAVLGLTVMLLNIPFQSAIVWLSGRGQKKISPKKAAVLKWILGGVLLCFSIAIVADYVLPALVTN